MNPLDIAAFVGIALAALAAITAAGHYAHQARTYRQRAARAELRARAITTQLNQLADYIDAQSPWTVGTASIARSIREALHQPKD
ncbi:hypothetical protein [Streptomyces sp. PR69]|uniref:hypothetical protein n=1 Tax=Streptomyces sp. PR69 TaxID=2984950 RepID=UPI002263C96A|nr:hypothetical protein [Streptomyces sp. PR69]